MLLMGRMMVMRLRMIMTVKRIMIFFLDYFNDENDYDNEDAPSDPHSGEESGIDEEYERIVIMKYEKELEAKFGTPTFHHQTEN